MRRLAPSIALALCLASLMAPARAQTDPNDLASQQWALDAIGARSAWQIADGSGVTVAVVDTGVDLQHGDLRGKLVPGHDFVDDDEDPQDDDGHGTHVAGIIGALARNGGTDGVAPGARIMPVRVLNGVGLGNDEDVLAGIRWAVSHGAKVVNLSLGDDAEQVFGPSFTEAIREAWNAGVVCVVAAGNQFVTSSTFTDEPAVIVTSTDRNDASPSYASGVGSARWGIAAPGGELPTPTTEENAVISTYWVRGQKDQYAYLAGTSQAAPHVAGAIAVLLSTGKFTPAQAVQRVLDSAKDIGPQGRDPQFGYGRLDLAAAVRDVRSSSSGPGATVSTTARSTNGSSTTAALPLPSLAPPTVLPDRPVDHTVASGPEVTIATAATGEHHRGGRTVPTVLASLALVATTVMALRWFRGRRISDDVS